MTNAQSVKDILKKFNPLEDKYITREFQAFAVHLSKKLNDERRKSLYMRLSKTIPRPILEEALRYVVDANARNKAALFMWKLKELNAFQKKIKSEKNQIRHSGEGRNPST
ncbi:hypothetical protein M1328_05440 [Patescibacteria group bacterium]|nr:hypothetical protein [Patescibacteria group bacterium]